VSNPVTPSEEIKLFLEHLELHVCLFFKSFFLRALVLHCFRILNYCCPGDKRAFKAKKRIFFRSYLTMDLFELVVKFYVIESYGSLFFLVESYYHILIVEVELHGLHPFYLE
jgi:hypothetical protein